MSKLKFDISMLGGSMYILLTYICMYMYACVYVCICVCVYVYIYIFIGMLHYIVFVILHAFYIEYCSDYLS